MQAACSHSTAPSAGAGAPPHLHAVLAQAALQLVREEDVAQLCVLQDRGAGSRRWAAHRVRSQCRQGRQGRRGRRS